MNNYFIFCEDTHNIQNFQIISNENKKAMKYGQEIVKFRTFSLWTNLTEEYKLAFFLELFFKKISKTRNPKHAPVGYAKLCKKSDFIFLFTFLVTYFFVCFFYFLFFAAWYIVVTFLQLPILWREWINEFSIWGFRW